MTIPQVLHALGTDGDSTRIADLAAQRRTEILDVIIARNGWLPSRLLDMPIADIAMRISSEADKMPVDLSMLAAFIQQYIREYQTRQQELK